MPDLAPVLDRLEDAPEPLRQFYVQKDGKFHVSLSGAPAGFVPASDLAIANGKVVEFRDNNLKLVKEVEDLRPIKAKFEGIDPDAAKAAIAKVADLGKKGVKDADDIQTLITSAVTAAVKPVQDQLAQITTANAETTKKNEQLILRNTIGDKFLKAGGQPDAVDFMLGKAHGVFVVADGSVKAAPNQFSADKPGEALSVDEWLTRQTKESSFVFKASGGGGADAAKGGNGGGGKPGQIVVRDPTPQQIGEYGDDLKAGKVRFEFTV